MSIKNRTLYMTSYLKRVNVKHNSSLCLLFGLHTEVLDL